MRSIMFRNSNAELEKELAAEDYKARPVRNRIAVLAVALTAILLVVVFSVGIGMVKTVSLSMGASPGPGADSSSIRGDEEVLERVRALPQVEWAALARRCSTTYLHNREFNGLDVRLLAADSVHYEKNMVDLINGKYPESADEILLSDTMSERLGLGQETGISYTLKVVVQEEEGETEKEIPMTVCGYYKNPLRNVKDIYEEIYTGEDFISTYNPHIIKGFDTIYIKLNNLDFFRFGYDKDEKLSEVNELAGGNGGTYKSSNLTVFIIVPVFLIVCCIMFCGYFFIYNVFDISVVNDIRFYGELKTIGMTSRQLRRMLSWQMNRIAFFGIVAGGLAGYGIGRAAGEKLVDTFAEGVAGYYQPAGFAETFLVSAVFAWMTVYISTMKPFRTACHISPVEAARYGGRRKKGIFSIISFALSGILFLAVYTLSMGYRVEVMMERYHETDFRIYHRASLWSQEEAYQPVSQDLVRRLESLDFVENLRVYYLARTKPDYYEEHLMYSGSYSYMPSMAEIAKDGELARDMEAYNEILEKDGLGIGSNMYYDGFTESGRGNLRVKVLGITPEYLPDEEKYLTVLEGILDAEEFSKGGYMIYQRSPHDWADKAGEGMEYQVHAGDKISVNFYDDAADRFVEKKLTVMAVITMDDMFGTGNIQDANIIIDDAAFRSIYSDHENLVSRISFDVSERDKAQSGETMLSEEQYEAVRNMMEEDGNMQLNLDSRYRTKAEFTETKKTITAFGIFLSAVVGLIGISNMVNTVTTDVVARRLEYASMQSIGMTRKQMEKDIFLKYARYIFTATGLAAAAGAPLTYMFAADPVFTGFSALEFLQAFAMFLVFSVLLCARMARLLTGTMNKKSIVERLREAV